ncbi:MAG: sortase [Candidatus Parcubacteria bacterium]|nr:sortase [Candidatus Paceibacterota bacterium]
MLIPSSYPLDNLIARASDHILATNVELASFQSLDKPLDVPSSGFSLPLPNNQADLIENLDTSSIPIQTTPEPIFVPPKKLAPDSKNNDKSVVVPEPQTPSIPAIIPPKSLSLTISKIGLEQISLAYGTNRNITQIDKLLLNSPVIENQDAVNICSAKGNSYIYGHSEPPDDTNPGMAGRIFGKLASLSPGDTIELVTADGQGCKYKVDKWDKMVVDKNNNIDINEYHRAMDYPDKPTDSSLTIQTCQKGSTVVRLLLRASRV